MFYNDEFARAAMGYWKSITTITDHQTPSRLIFQLRDQIAHSEMQLRMLYFMVQRSSGYFCRDCEQTIQYIEDEICELPKGWVGDYSHAIPILKCEVCVKKGGNA